jgi:TorA maturation chaperone TorD
MLDRSLAPLFRFAGAALLRPDPEALLKSVPEVQENGFLTEEFEQELVNDPEGVVVEFVRLFLNPAGSICPLYQSAYDEPKELRGWSHHRALAWYGSEGFEVDNPGEPADHAGRLLIFLAHLLEQGAARERIEAFYQDHLRWLMDFSATVDRETRHPFFRTLAETLELALEPGVVCQ